MSIQRKCLLNALTASIWSASSSRDAVEEDRDPLSVSELRSLAVCASKGIEDVIGRGVEARSAIEDLLSSVIASDPDEPHDEADNLHAVLSLKIAEAESLKMLQLETEAVEIDSLLQVKELK